MTDIRAEVVVRGRVQGVWFRQSTANEAQNRGLGGWCRNNPDGTVTAVFEGEESAVREMIEWCRSGPKLARVDELRVTTAAATGEFNDFTVRAGAN